MAYKKRYYKKKNNRKIKKTKGNKVKQLVDGQYQQYIDAGVSAIPYLIKSVGMLKSLVNSEPKYVDTSATVTTVGTTMQYGRLTGIAQGDLDTNRIGNKILLKDVLLRFYVIMNATATNQIFRCMLIVDKEADGASPTSPQPLQTNDVNSPISMDYSKRFVIIKTWHLDCSINGNRGMNGKCYKELNIHCDFDGAGSGIGDAKENQLYFAYMSSDNTLQGTVAYYGRVKYYDS